MSTAVSTTLETARPGIGTWTLDASHTLVEFAVKHLMIASVKGRFAGVSGSVAIDPARPQAAALEVSIDVATIDTRDEKRDAHLRSADFFEAERFPVIRFAGKRVEGDVNGKFRVVGDLTIRNVTREVALDVTSAGRVTDPWGGERMGFSATARVNRLDYGLKWNVALEAGGVLVGEEVGIHVEAEFVRQS